MDKANNIEEFVNGIADGLSMGCSVKYDMKNLEYGELHQMQLEEYGDYVDMAELPEDIGDELHDWEIDEVNYLRAVLELPDRIEPPRTWAQIDKSLTGGSHYDATDFDGFRMRRIWICPVTLCVLGCYPKYLYVKKIG